MKQRYLLIIALLLVILGTAPCFCADEDKGPVIGITFRKEATDNYGSYLDGYQKSCQAIQNNGGRVLELSQLQDEATLTSNLDKIQGLLIPGGPDIHPSFYNQEPLNDKIKYDKDFDHFEYRILKYAHENKLPILGICRGEQLINIFFGGTLYQEISLQVTSGKKVNHRTFSDGEIKSVDHMINLARDTFLYETFLFQNRIEVNSSHHQSIKEKGKGLDIIARSDDYVIEAIMGNGRVFLLGVQFHPEKMLDKNPQMNKIFQRLVREAKRVKRTSPTSK